VGKKNHDLWEKAGWLYCKAKALVAYSKVAAHVNQEESKKCLMQAAQIFSKLGAKHDLDRIAARVK